MAATVKARLDTESQVALETLTQSLGMNRSQVIRASLRHMVQQLPASNSKKLIGVGKFDSGVHDLSTNKKYMEGFGLTRVEREKLERSRKSY